MPPKLNFLSYLVVTHLPFFFILEKRRNKLVICKRISNFRVNFFIQILSFI
ncbi:transmembrane protein, putative [Medicago truncatula]|uniref:Transmembrane protein, putative n=1 Tax=Medicago truncatula TaxID=3880 RepID=G7I7R1_MEDTR|nr:transmembrane protein, putative [Medicago truncatula]